MITNANPHTPTHSLAQKHTFPLPLTHTNTRQHTPTHAARLAHTRTHLHTVCKFIRGWAYKYRILRTGILRTDL